MTKKTKIVKIKFAKDYSLKHIITIYKHSFLLIEKQL